MTWEDAAACRGHHDLFFHPGGGAGAKANAACAAICARCPVLDACEADRASFEIHPVYVHGFRAGRTAAARKDELRAAAKAAGRVRLEPPERIRARRRALVLADQGWSLAEIAADLGVTDRNVSRWLAESRAERGALCAA